MLSDAELRALTAPLDLTALFACMQADQQQLYYGVVRHLCVDYMGLVNDSRFIVARRDALLL
jgi:hypothetical protein